MKKSFSTSSDITVRRIGAKDWALYRDYYNGLDDPSHFQGFMNGKDTNTPETYMGLFKELGDFVMFGLFDHDKMVGQTGIYFKGEGENNVAVLAGSEITPSYRKNGYSRDLYEARLRYLKDMEFSGKVITAIRPDNVPSLAAAERQGFVKTDNTVHNKIILALNFEEPSQTGLKRPKEGSEDLATNYSPAS